MATTFIGGGNMATALIGGMLARGAVPTDFRIVEPSADARARLAAQFAGAALFGECTRDAIAGAALVVLAVKPQHDARCRPRARAAPCGRSGAGRAVTGRIVDRRRHPPARSRPLVERHTKDSCGPCRTLPRSSGRGSPGRSRRPSVDAGGRALVSSVLAAAGEQIWVDDEAMLDAVTAVSGSGPAYVFYFLEALEAAARDLGFAPADARRLAYATFGGSIALAQASEAEPATLRAQVTSKGGTTERAIASLEAAAIKAGIVAAVKAAAQRAAEMGDAFGVDG